jgi:hypothetical protein
MLFVTFLQVPLADLGEHSHDGVYIGTRRKLCNNSALQCCTTPSRRPVNPLGVLLVLTPCIDYVVTLLISVAPTRNYCLRRRPRCFCSNGIVARLSPPDR